jgi:hypothetical protein
LAPIEGYTDALPNGSVGTFDVPTPNDPPMAAQLERLAGEILAEA